MVGREALGSRDEVMSDEAALIVLTTIADNAAHTQRNAERLCRLLATNEPGPEQARSRVTVTSHSSAIGLDYFMDPDLSDPENTRHRVVSLRGGSQLHGVLIGIEPEPPTETDEPTDYLVVDVSETGEPEVLCYFKLDKTLAGCLID